MRRITFSRNYTLSLSRTCRCYCTYCAFATHQAHLHTPEEVERELEQAPDPADVSLEDQRPGHAAQARAAAGTREPGGPDGSDQ